MNDCEFTNLTCVCVRTLNTLYLLDIPIPYVPRYLKEHPLRTGESSAEGIEMIFEKLANFVIKHAKLVLLVWIVILLASAYPALHASEKFSYSTTSMGSSTNESIDGMLIIQDHFESQTDSESMQMVLIVYDTADAETLKTLNNKLLAIPASDDKISSVIATGDPIPGTGDNAGKNMLLYAVSYKTGLSADDIANDTKNLRELVDTAVNDSFSGKNVNYDTYVTGTPAISYDASKAMTKDLSLVDPISILLILVLIGLFFRSLVTSAAPPITIGVAYALVLCALFLIISAFSLEIYYVIEMLLIVSMLGAGCDYCIFILSRYREERRRGLEHEDACRAAITWAGESVFTSGMAVMIGFGAMMICDFRLVSNMGMGLAIGIVFALLAALTLMSSLLVLLGDKLFWPSGASGEKLEQGYLKKMGNLAKRYFEISTHFSIKYAKVIVVATILFTVPMAYIYATSDDSYDMIGSMMNGESQEGIIVLTDYAGGGAIMPNYAIIETSQPLGTITYVGEGDNKLGMLTWSTEMADSTHTYRDVTRAELTAISADVAKLDNVSSVYYSSFDNPEYGALSVTWGESIVPLLTLAGMDPNSDDIILALEALKSTDSLPASAIAMIDKIEDMFNTNRATIHAIVTDGAPGETIPFGIPKTTAIMDWLLFVQTGTVGTTYNAETNTATINYVNLTMATKEQAMSDKSIETVGEFRTIVHDHVDKSTLLKDTWITGTAAVMVEIKDVVDQEFLKVELTAIILIIILLFFVLKSYITPIRAVGTIFMSVIWTVAITHLLFDNVLHAGVLWILPIMLIVICLGLGMDYDILLTTRIREYRFNKGMDNDEAIRQAVLHSGSVITLCGFIMGGTFGTLMLSSTVMLQQMGFALCFAILVDALIVRTYIVPAMMHLLGKWNWVGPRFLTGRKEE